MKISKQKSAEKMWTDESGVAIPYNRTTAYERAAENKLYSVAKKGLAIHEELTEFKAWLEGELNDLYELFEQENGILGQGKGTATFYNFDRSIKVTRSVKEPIRFDENTIALAKAKLDEFLAVGLEGAKEFIKPIVMDAFQTSRGNLDTKRVLGLRKYAQRANHPMYTEAMYLIDKAIRRPKTKEYVQVWVRDGSGEYKDVQLNFASI